MERTILKSTQFQPGIHEFYGSDGFRAGADNIALDFTGVVLEGGCHGEERKILPGDLLLKELYNVESTDEAERARVEKLGYCGIALLLKGVKNVVVRGLTARGFRIGIAVVDCENITIEDCILSGNFHDPECGWDEHGPGGGILLYRSENCVIRRNRANQVWNGIYLRESQGNVVMQNDFSFASNMCVKMWNASHNLIDGNNLSWGLRIKPGEVHARDSAGLLMDSGCDYNRVCNNDITHGGDGIFIRALNGWQSCHNLFVNNDCSYANNNAIEAWSNHNTYIRNKANDSSYGFWLGGSDFTLLYENEACRNGIRFANAPEFFGTCAIAVAGSGNHFRVIGNKICGNRGPGIAVRNTVSAPVFHWILEDNEISRNHSTGQFKGHGIYMKNAGDFRLSGNVFQDNEGEDIFDDGNVFDVRMLEEGNCPIRVSGTFPAGFVKAGEALEYRAAVETPAEDYTLRWTFGDGTASEMQCPVKIYRKPGSYYAGVTAANSCRSAMDGAVIYVCPEGRELSIQKAELTGDGEGGEILESSCSRVRAYSHNGTRRELRFQIDGVWLGDFDSLGLYLRLTASADTDWDRTVKSPVLTLVQDEENYITVVPQMCTSDGIFAEKTWEKCGHRFYSFPLDSSDTQYRVEKNGSPQCIREIRLTILHKNPGRVEIEVNRPVLYRDETKLRGENIGDNPCREWLASPRLTASRMEGNDPAQILDPSNGYVYSATRYWHSPEVGAWAGIEWDQPHDVSGIGVGIMPEEEDGEWQGRIQYLEGELWQDICSRNLNPLWNAVSFPAIRSTGIRILFGENCPRLYRLTACGRKEPMTGDVSLRAIQCRIFIESDGSNSLSDLVVQIYRTENRMPAGTPVISRVIPKESIVSGKVCTIPYETQPLSQGTYAAVFTQEKLAASRTEGEYYRFCTAYAGHAQYSGVGTGGTWKDETDVFGTLWMRVVTDREVLDYSHEGEGVGPRAGFKGCEYRYQTFTI